MRPLFFLLFFLLLSSQAMNAETPTRVRYKEVPPKTPLTVSQVIGNGAYLMLSDDTVWAIAPADTLLSGEWISAGEITIQNSNDPAFPFLLFNNITQDSVHARKSSLEEVRRKTRPLELQKQKTIIDEQKAEQKAEELKK